MPARYNEMSAKEFHGLSTAGGFGQVGGGLPDESDLDVLLQRPEVLGELSLTRAQRVELEGLIQDHRRAFAEEAAARRTVQPARASDWFHDRQGGTDERIRRVLDAEQFELLLRLRWRRLGPLAVFDPEVRRRLGLSANQQNRLREMEDEMERRRHEVQAAISHMRSVEAARGHVDEEYTRPAGELVMKVLDEAQRSALDKLTSDSEGVAPR